MEKILELDHIPSGMELFSAGDEEDWAAIRKAIDQCDIYVVVVGGLFGSVFEETGESFTQREFGYARDVAKKPILAFLLDANAYQQERHKLRPENLKTEDDAKRALQERANEPKLLQFREEVKSIDRNGEKRRLVKFVTSPDDLSSKFATSLQKLVKEPRFNLAGWRRFSADVGKNEFVQSVVNKLGEFDKLSHRCVEDRPKLKEAMGRYFWDNFGYQFVTQHDIRNLYFESGSTIAHVSSEFRKTKLFSNHRHDWRIRTNNILTYLHFVLFEDVQIDLFPHGPPENKYGATYGTLGTLDDPGWPEQNLSLSVLQPEAQKHVRKLAKEILPRDEPSLILGTASGLELKPDSGFPGPHAGTFINKLLKRVLLETRHPTILFLDDEKISPITATGHFQVGLCHHVCDSGLSWKEVCGSHPLAVCIGASTRGRLDAIVEALIAAGLTEMGRARQYSEYSGGWATLVYNKTFDAAIGKQPTARPISHP